MLGQRSMPHLVEPSFRCYRQRHLHLQKSAIALGKPDLEFLELALVVQAFATAAAIPFLFSLSCWVSLLIHFSSKSDVLQTFRDGGSWRTFFVVVAVEYLDQWEVMAVCSHLQEEVISASEDALMVRKWPSWRRARSDARFIGSRGLSADEDSRKGIAVPA